MFVRHCRAILAAVVVVSAAGCADATREQILSSIDATASQIPVTLAETIESDVVAHIDLVGRTIPKRRSVVVSEVDGVIQQIPTAGDEYFDDVEEIM